MLRLTLLALAGLLGPAAVRPDSQASETELKAAWIYNFAQHVEWPAAAFKDDKAPLVIGVLGTAAIEEPLGRAVRGKQAQGRTVEIRRAAQPADLKGAHIIFVPDAEKDRLDQVLSAVHGTAVLVVGESDGLSRRGAAFNFYSDDARVRFEANVDTATRAGLAVGSKLLKFARLVKD